MSKVNRASAFLLLVLLSIAAVLITVGVTLGLPVAIKGLYALVGAILSLGIIYRVRNADFEEATETSAESKRLIKLLLVLSSISIAVTGFTGSTLAGFLVVLPTGYALTAWRATIGISRRYLLIAAIILFLTPLAIRYLGSGFYFGGGDLNWHIPLINQVTYTGSISGIETPYNLIPGYHLLLTSTSLITMIPPSDIPFTVGAITYAQGLVLVYIVAREMFKDARLGAISVLATTFVPELSYFGSYFFPQALAVILLLNLLTFSILSRNRSNGSAFSIINIVLGITIVFTHHLSILLFAPLYGIILAYSYLSDKIRISQLKVAFSIEPRYLPYLTVVMFASFYWLYLTIFVGGLITQALIATNQYVSPNSSGGFYWFGVSRPIQTVSTAFGTLLSADIISGMLLLMMFLVGIWYIIMNRTELSAAYGILSIGVIGAVFIFPTPIFGKGFTRLGQPTNFFFALIIGFGLLPIFLSAKRDIVLRIAVVCIVVVLGTITPILGGGSVGGITQGYSTQNVLTPSEEAQIESLATFNEHYETEIQTDWVTKGAMRRHGTSARQFTVSSNGLHYRKGLVVYRSTWPDHVIIVTNSTYKARFVLSNEWLRKTMQKQSKVYSTGVVRAVYRERSGMVNATS